MMRQINYGIKNKYIKKININDFSIIMEYCDNGDLY
jgi:hypothetical protein